jgi:hypothetical protein
MKIRIPIFTREPISGHITFLSKDTTLDRNSFLREVASAVEDTCEQMGASLH